MVIIKVPYNINFLLQNPVVFDFSSSFDPTEISVYSVDSFNNPEYYLLKKSTPVISAERVSKDFQIGNIERFLILDLIDEEIINIESIVDSDGNEYTEVPYLAQDIIFENISNVQGNTTSLYENYTETPYLLKLKRVPRRFVSRFTANNILELQFGAGDSNKSDEEILPVPDNIGLGGRDGRSKLDQSIDPSNFLHSQTYGKAPSNTTLTVTYLRGGGIRSNVPQNTINKINSITTNIKPNLSGPIVSFCRESIACSNPIAATGGGGADTIEEIKQKTAANFATQQRVITKEDYLIRTLSMPSIYGSIAKAYIVKSTEIEKENLNVESSQISSNLYLLGYNNNKKLTTCNNATKTNLATYLNYYKPLTDSINLMDAFIINFGIDFEISTFRNNNNQTLEPKACYQKFPFSKNQLIGIKHYEDFQERIPREEVEGLRGRRGWRRAISSNAVSSDLGRAGSGEWAGWGAGGKAGKPSVENCDRCRSIAAGFA